MRPLISGQDHHSPSSLNDLDSHPEHSVLDSPIYPQSSRAYNSRFELLEDIICSEDDIYIWNRFEDRRLDDWAYVIDLDANTFEVYKGWNDVPVPETERFHASETSADTTDIQPFKELVVYSLDDFPSVDQFLRDCDEELKCLKG